MASQQDWHNSDSLDDWRIALTARSIAFSAHFC